MDDKMAGLVKVIEVEGNGDAFVILKVWKTAYEMQLQT